MRCLLGSKCLYGFYSYNTAEFLRKAIAKKQRQRKFSKT